MRKKPSTICIFYISHFAIFKLELKIEGYATIIPVFFPFNSRLRWRKNSVYAYLLMAARTITRTKLKNWAKIQFEIFDNTLEEQFWLGEEISSIILLCTTIQWMFTISFRFNIKMKSIQAEYLTKAHYFTLIYYDIWYNDIEYESMLVCLFRNKRKNKPEIPFNFKSLCVLYCIWRSMKKYGLKQWKDISSSFKLEKGT